MFISRISAHGNYVKVRIPKIFLKSDPIFDTIYGQHFFSNIHLAFLLPVISEWQSPPFPHYLPTEKEFTGNVAFYVSLYLCLYCSRSDSSIRATKVTVNTKQTFPATDSSP